MNANANTMAQPPEPRLAHVSSSSLCSSPPPWYKDIKDHILLHQNDMGKDPILIQRHGLLMRKGKDKQKREEVNE
jgi:hypothetical protein